MTKVENNYRKNVTTKKFMSRHNEELKVEIFVDTIGSYVATLIEEKCLEENCRIRDIFEDCRNTVREKELAFTVTVQNLS